MNNAKFFRTDSFREHLWWLLLWLISCEFYKISKNTFFHRTPPAAAFLFKNSAIIYDGNFCENSLQKYYFAKKIRHRCLAPCEIAPCFQCLKVQSCKINNNKHMIVSVQITNTGIFMWNAEV